MSHNQIQQIRIGAFLIVALLISETLCDCTAHCKICKAGTCKLCRSGYTLDSNDICTPCPPNCRKCKDRTSCKVCRPTHFLSAGVCLPCNIDNCKYCDSNNICTRCSTGYYMKENKRCHPCKQDCLECSNESSCQICESGFFKNLLSECKSCGIGCFKCLNSTICSKCNPGFWLMGNECKQCQDNCATCKDAYTCDKCKNGHYGQKCLSPCPGNCLGDRCNKSGRCTDGCVSGFYGVLCNNPCPYCQGQRCHNNGNCRDGCVSGFHGVLCDKPCPKNCQGQRCHNNGNCRDGCLSGFYGVSCDQPCPENCHSRTCDTHGMCKEGCLPGYYGEMCTLDCVESHCANNVCNQNNGTCIEKCLQTCTSCGEHSHCFQCRKGFYGTSCEYDCSTCHEGACNRYNCTSGCKKGYFLDGNECKQCSKNCTSCESIDTCSLCVDGNYGKQCQKMCEAKCFACSNVASNCTKCYRGYNLMENKCCPKNCNTCGQDGSCTRCEEGFFGENCTNKCQGYCKSCDNTHKCTECGNLRYDSQFENEAGLCSCNTKQCSEATLLNNTCGHCKLRGWYTYKNGCCLCPKNCSNYRQCITSEYCKGCRTELMDQICKCQSDTCSSCTNENCEKCQSGYFGNDCRYTCSVNCSQSRDDSVCDKSSGHCLHGCVNGTWGDMCNKTCTLTCKDGLCDVITGNCLICDDGRSGSRCLHATSPQERQNGFLMPVIIVVSVVSALIVAVTIGCLIRKCRSKNHNADNTDKMNDIHRETGIPVYRLEGHAEEGETTENATYGMFELSPEAVALEVERARQITRPRTETTDAVARATVFRKQSDSEESTENAMYGAFELSPEEVAVEIERAQRINAPPDGTRETRNVVSAIDVEYSKPIKKSSLSNQAASSVDPDVIYSIPDK